MSVSGSLRTMSVEDLLDWLDRRLMSGTLTVDNGTVIRQFAFDSGSLISAASNSLAEQPEQVLFDLGLIDNAALSQARVTSAESGNSVIVEVQNLVEFEPDQLTAVLQEHAVESLLDTLVCKAGTFAFETAEDSDIIILFPVSVRLRNIIVQGRQRAYRWRQIRAHIPEDDVQLEIVERARMALEEDSEDALQYILAMTRALDNGMTTQQLFEQRNGRRFAVLDLLATLVERGGLRVAGRPEREPDPTPREAAEGAGALERAARAKAEAGDLGEALLLAERALAIEPGHKGLQTLRRDLERSLFAELSRELLTSFRVPKLLVEPGQIEQMELTDIERYLSGRVDGRWDLLSLMRVAPVREVEALITFKRLADRGIISL